jgi:hypothetical protein
MSDRVFHRKMYAGSIVDFASACASSGSVVLTTKAHVSIAALDGAEQVIAIGNSHADWYAKHAASAIVVSPDASRAYAQDRSLISNSFVYLARALCMFPHPDRARKAAPSDIGLVARRSKAADTHSWAFGGGRHCCLLRRQRFRNPSREVRV